METPDITSERNQIHRLVCSSMLCQHDPLGKLFLKISPSHTWPIVILAFMLYGVSVMGGGTVLSFLYEEKGVNFVSLFDKREFPFAVFSYLVIVPLIWSFYRWQLTGISDVVRRLEQNGVVGKVKGEKPIQTILRARKILLGKGALWLALLPVVIGSVIRKPFPFAQKYWWGVNVLYFWLVWMPLVFVNSYMAAWFVFRQIYAVIVFNALFSIFQIRPKVFHPDGANGLAPVGDYTLRSALIAVLAGFWAFANAAFPMLFGEPMDLRLDTDLMFLAYMFAVPAFFFLPAWGTHKAMTRFKDILLEEFADQINSLLKLRGEEMLSTKEMLIELKQRYEMVDTYLQTWPFRPLSAKKFGISAIMPLVSTGISHLIEWYLKQ